MQPIAVERFLLLIVHATAQKEPFVLATDRPRHSFAEPTHREVAIALPKLTAESLVLASINTVLELFDVEHIYRGFRISLRQNSDGWHAKFWRVSGASVMLKAFATETEGDSICLIRANQAVDHFLDYVGGLPEP